MDRKGPTRRSVLGMLASTVTAPVLSSVLTTKATAIATQYIPPEAYASGWDIFSVLSYFNEFAPSNCNPKTKHPKKHLDINYYEVVARIKLLTRLDLLDATGAPEEAYAALSRIPDEHGHEVSWVPADVAMRSKNAVQFFRNPTARKKEYARLEEAWKMEGNHIHGMPPYGVPHEVTIEYDVFRSSNCVLTPVPCSNVCFEFVDSTSPDSLRFLEFNDMRAIVGFHYNGVPPYLDGTSTYLRGFFESTLAEYHHWTTQLHERAWQLQDSDPRPIMVFSCVFPPEKIATFEQIQAKLDGFVQHNNVTCIRLPQEDVILAKTPEDILSLVKRCHAGKLQQPQGLDKRRNAAKVKKRTDVSAKLGASVSDIVRGAARAFRTTNALDAFTKATPPPPAFVLANPVQPVAALPAPSAIPMEIITDPRNGVAIPVTPQQVHARVMRQP